MSDQFAPEYIRAIAPYQAGKPISEVAREFGLDENRIIKLASNENRLNPRKKRSPMKSGKPAVIRMPMDLH